MRQEVSDSNIRGELSLEIRASSSPASRRIIEMHLKRSHGSQAGFSHIFFAASCCESLVVKFR